LAADHDLTVCAGKDGTVDMSRKKFLASVIDAFLKNQRASKTRELQYLGVAENLT